MSENAEMERQADLIIGIDVGTSSTRVAYLNKAKGRKTVEVLYVWDGEKVEDKYPTRLSYPADDADGTARPFSWGFNCTSSHRDGVLVENFKVDLGDHTKTEAQRNKAKRHFGDYLVGLYRNLSEHFTPYHLKGKIWDQAVIDFHFSMPASWSTTTVELFTQLVIDAGFSQYENFRVITSLTEPFAVAACTLVEEPEVLTDGKKVLIIDAGGRTVDFSFLEIGNTAEGQLTSQGIEHRSTYIDKEFETNVTKRLEPLKQRGLLENSAAVTAARMIDNFQSIKHDFMPTNNGDDGVFKMEIPGMRSEVDDPELQVTGMHMVFKGSDIRQFYNRQMEEIKSTIGSIMRNHACSPSRRDKLDLVLLSGGLGSSPFVQEQIRGYLNSSTSLGDSIRHLLSDTELHVAIDPQLCVCKGLVYHAERNMVHSLVDGEPTGNLSRLSLDADAALENENRNETILDLVNNDDKHVSRDENDQKFAEDCMSNHIASVDTDKPAAAQSIDLTIMVSADDEPPAVYETDTGLVQENATLNIDLSKTKPTMQIKLNRSRMSEVGLTIEAAVGTVNVSFRFSL